MPASPSSREKILEVAEAHFARRGFSGVGLRELAAAAGLGTSSLFHHFAGKAQLYFEVLERVLARIQVRLAAALARSASPRERLEGWIDALIDALAEHPASARLLLRGLVEDEDFPDEPLPEAQRAEQLLADILQGIHALLHEGIDRGAFRKVSVPHTVQTLIGATVYLFASGELGESIMGRPLLSAEAVRRRKQELHQLLQQGLAAQGADRAPGRT